MTKAKDTKGKINFNRSRKRMTYIQQKRVRIIISLGNIISGVLIVFIPFLDNTIVSWLRYVLLIFTGLMVMSMGLAVIVEMLYGNAKKSKVEDKDILHPRNPIAYLLNWLPEEYQEYLTGDLEEEFPYMCNKFGHKAAVRWYYWQVLRTIYRSLLNIGRKIVRWVI